MNNLAEAVELYLEEVDDPQRHVTATPLVTSFQVPRTACALRSLTCRSPAEFLDLLR